MAIWDGNPRLGWDQTLTHSDWIQVAPGIVGPDQAAALTVRVYMDHSDSMADLPGIRQGSSRCYRLHAPGGTPATVWFCCCNECTRRGGGYSFDTLSIQ